MHTEAAAQPRVPNRAAAAAAFAVAGLVAAYWIFLVVTRAAGTGASLDAVFLLLVGALMALVPALVGMRFLAAPPQRFEGVRLPAAGVLAVVGLVGSLAYGYGLYASIAAVMLAHRQRRAGGGSAIATVIFVVAWVGVVAGAIMTLLAVGLCGPRVFIGQCDA